MLVRVDGGEEDWLRGALQASNRRKAFLRDGGPGLAGLEGRSRVEPLHKMSLPFMLYTSTNSLPDNHPFGVVAPTRSPRLVRPHSK